MTWDSINELFLSAHAQWDRAFWEPLHRTHTHFLTSLSVCGFTCLAERYSVTKSIKLNKYLEWRGKVISNTEIRTFVHNLIAIQYAIFVPGNYAETSFGSSRKQWPRAEHVIYILYARCRKNTEVSYIGINWKEYCVINDGFYFYKPTMIVFLTLCTPLYWRINKSRLTIVKNITLLKIIS